MTTRGILSRVQRKRKRVEGAAVDAMSMQTVTSDGELRSNNREEEVENLWNCPEFETLSDDEDACPRGKNDKNVNCIKFILFKKIHGDC